MGKYNPTAPYILGQEFVPIRDEDILFSGAVNVQERGHRFITAQDYVLQDTRFYLSEFANVFAKDKVFLASIYTKGTEDQTGPIRSVVIPVNNGAISGGAQFTFEATTVTQALYSPMEYNGVFFTTQSVSTNKMAAYFAVNQYAALLANKRILRVNLLINAAGNYTTMDTKSAISGGRVAIANDAGTVATIGTTASQIGGPSVVYTMPGVDVPNSDSVTVAAELSQTVAISLGEIDPFWSATLSPFTTVDRMPWTYESLQRFEASATNRHSMYIDWTQDGGVAPTAAMFVTYMALEVIYCEEQRVTVGARSFGPNTGYMEHFVAPGANLIPMRSLSTFAQNPVLPAGDYYLTVSLAETGHISVSGVKTNLPNQETPPTINALRELYAVPGHEGIQVNVSHTVDKTFTSEQSHILPQLSLHTSGGPLTEVHVYGRQAVAQVWGTITATQEILDSAAGTATDYTQVRFLARRFGDTTVPLTLDSPSIPGPSVSITPGEFDALSTIIDGWKEITLPLSSAASMGTGTAPQWRWSATGETKGNRWEILGATAPALSGIPGNLLNLVPAPNQLSIATYGAPVSGAQINLGWVPQYAPAVTATTDDNTSDAFLIFSVDMLPVTGFAVIESAQAVSGIGQQCGLDPCCIPNSISYHTLTWSATSSSVPVSGFGYYELQRMDTVDTDWQTIMKNTSPTGASFRDYEARVGILSSYRIRAVNVYEFAGPWSSTVTSTITAPGISSQGNCVVNGHSLIFTSNERQDGSINLAYSTVWEGSTRVEEGFAFPEAGATVLQPMFDRDFFTAFRPLERGGEQFSRTLLVQAAAIAPPTLGDFRALRDMAWDTVSYICVRDEDGNRWLANVVVPSGRVQRSRTLYFAQVNVAEVTAIPSPVDPSS